MRAGCSAGCGVALAMVAATGCAPLFTGETGPASPEGLYRSPERVVAAASDGVYGAEVRAGVQAPEAPSPAAEAAPPAVLVLRTHECCPGPLIVTVACADGSSTARDRLYDQDAPPPAPYKPWPYEGRRAPSLYHDP